MGIGGFFVLLGIILILWGKGEERRYYESTATRADVREFLERWPERPRVGGKDRRLDSSGYWCGYGGCGWCLLALGLRKVNKEILSPGEARSIGLQFIRGKLIFHTLAWRIRGQGQKITEIEFHRINGVSRREIP
jgi:hypothetical protein